MQCKPIQQMLYHKIYFKKNTCSQKTHNTQKKLREKNLLKKLLRLPHFLREKKYLLTDKTDNTENFARKKSSSKKDLCYP